MKNIKNLGIALLLLLVTSCIQQQQYISYKVQKGETISSIAKRYGITEGELLRVNPGIGKNPPENTVIVVPERKGILKQTKETSNNQSAKEYSIYTARKGDTLFSLSKRFGMTIDELKEINPILKDGLKAGMELLYVKGNEVSEEAEDSLEGYEIHTVVKGDTVYNLTHRYHISEEELYGLNPELSKGLKIGMLLKIRKKEVEKIEEDVLKEDESAMEASLFLDNLTTGKEVTIAVMLPYQINKLKNDTIISKKFESKNSLTNIATDVHQGVLMAIDSLRSRGVQVNVQFFDTENSQRKLGKILLHNDFSKYDAVIGPLFFDKAQLMASQVNVPVVMPFYSKKQTGIAPDNLIKSTPSQKETEEKLLNYINENYNDEKVLVVSDDKETSKSKLWRVVNQLKAFNKIKDLTVLKPQKGYIDRERFQSEIRKDTANWVVLIGNDVVTTADVVNNLGVYPDDIYHIRLFSFGKGENFNKVSNNYLGRLHFTYPTSMYNDIFNDKVKYFYQKFKAKNNNLPSKYALRGFDVTYDVIARIVSYQTFDESLQQGKSARLISVFGYNKNQNNGLILVQYNNDLKPEVIE